MNAIIAPVHAPKKTATVPTASAVYRFEYAWQNEYPDPIASNVYGPIQATIRQVEIETMNGPPIGCSETHPKKFCNFSLTSV